MEFRVLGPVEVDGPEGPLSLGGKRQRLVLAHLLLRANQLVPTDVLIDLLWDEEPPDGARNALQVSISRLRRAVGDRIQTREAGYSLRTEPGELDVERFEELVRDGRALVDADPQDAADTLREALAIWQGPAFADLADERSLHGEIARLTELRSLATEERLSSELALGRHKELIGELESLTTADPLRERLWGMLMLALYRSGRQADALAAYGRAREVLSDQLGIDPSRGLQRLHERILSQDPGLSMASGHAPSPSSQPGAAGDLPSGTRIGGYKIVDVLGRGGMSVVYLAEHEGLHRKVALKLLSPQLSSDERFRERFVRESQLAASLDHPNVIPIFEAGEADGYLFISMRYVDGTDLRKAIRANGALPTERTLSIMRQVGAALDAAHRRGLVHRDVKPGNVLIARTDTPGEPEQVYLSDFGLTKRASSLSGVTGTGQFVGTLDYAAPEQFQARRLDARTDVYSLGAMLFECLTGHPPFRRENDASLMHAHLTEAPPAVTGERAELPGAIDAVIARAMAKDPADRYQSAGDLVSEVTEALKRETAGVLLRTFMISDVRGYTTYTREHGDERAAELAARFADVVRDVVSQHGGILVELRGDEALAVFASARQAIRAAVALQAACREAALPRGVGVGVDAGEAVAVEGGYRGTALNLAARLCSEAAAGEVLASEAVTHLAAHVDGIAYTGLRTFDLKGFDEPVRAVRVVAEEEVPAVEPSAPDTWGRGRGWKGRIPLVVGGVVVLALLAFGLPRIVGGSSASTGFRPGVAFIDERSHELVGHVSSLQEPVESQFGDGAFWFLNQEPVSFAEVDPKTFRVLRSITSPVSDVASFAVDGGSLWVTDASHPVLWQIDVGTGREVTHRRFGEQTVNGLAGPAIGDGSVWIAAGSWILRLDPSTLAIQGKARMAGPTEGHLSYAEGSLWVPHGFDVLRVDPNTNLVAFHAAVPSQVWNAAGGGGFGWASSSAGNAVYQVSMRGFKVGTFATGEGPEAMAFDAGRLWIANNDSGTVGWIDPATGGTGSIPVGHPVLGIAAGDGIVAISVTKGLGVVDRVAALSGDVLRLIFPEPFSDTYDPALATDPSMFQVEQATCARLLAPVVAPAPAGWELVPEVAAAMPEVSANGRTYTFRIRDGYRFSPPSGEAVTAETFRYSIERALSPVLGSGAPGPRVIDDIEGEVDFRAGRSEHIAGLVTAGDTLQITLTAPSPSFLDRLAAPYFCPVPADTPILNGGVAADVLASVGPYYATENTPGELLILRRNPDYGGDRQLTFDAIAIRSGFSASIEDLGDGSAEQQVRTALSDGMIGGFYAGYAGSARDEPGFSSVALPQEGLIVLNADGTAFSQDRVRAAFASALDRFAIGRWVAEFPTDELIPPPLPGGTQEPSATLPDVHAANALMGDTSVHGVLAAPDCGAGRCRGIVNRIAKHMAKVGIHLSTVFVSWKQIAADPGRYDAVIRWQGIDFQDTATYVSRMIGDVAPASWYPEDQQREARRILGLSGEERTQSSVALADRMVAEHVVVPVVMFGRHDFLSDRLGCRVYPPFGFGVDLASLCINASPSAATPTP